MHINDDGNAQHTPLCALLVEIHDGVSEWGKERCMSTGSLVKRRTLTDGARNLCRL